MVTLWLMIWAVYEVVVGLFFFSVSPVILLFSKET